MYSTTDFRKSLKIEVDDVPYEIVEFQHFKPGKGGAMVRTKLRNILTGRREEITFRSGEKVGRPDMENRSMQYLYRDGTDLVFMDLSNYEQMHMNAELLGAKAGYLKESQVADVLFYRGSPLDIDLPLSLILTVADTEPGAKGDTVSGATKPAVLETNNHYLNRIGDVENIEELTDVLHSIVEDMAGQIFSFQGTRHAAALRKAERYIYENYTRKISLKEVADASGLSAPYFSNIFKEEMGENLTNYLNRLRVEKAGRLLTETEMSLSEIAGVCGFENQSWFSKIFTSFTGISPGKYRGQGGGIVQEISRDNFSENYRTAVKTE
jgi:elongation factor P